MSHFFVIAILEKPKDDSEIEGVIENMMAPYSESLETEGQEETCSCVGAQARTEAYQSLDKARSWEEVKRKFNTEFPQGDHQQEWVKICNSREEFTTSFVEKHSLKQTPDAD